MGNWQLPQEGDGTLGGGGRTPPHTHWYSQHIQEPWYSATCPWWSNKWFEERLVGLPDVRRYGSLLILLTIVVSLPISNRTIRMFHETLPIRRRHTNDWYISKSVERIKVVVVATRWRSRGQGTTYASCQKRLISRLLSIELHQISNVRLNLGTLLNIGFKSQDGLELSNTRTPFENAIPPDIQ